MQLTHREAVAQLAARAAKSNRGAGGYSRWVNRPLGRQLAAIAYRAGRSPNEISVASAACTYTALVLVAVLRPTWPMSTAVAVLLVLGYALDSADGQVARLTGTGTPAGEWLDHVLDAFKVSAFHLVVAVSWFRFYDLRHPALLLVPLGASFVATSFYFALTLSDMLRRIARARVGTADVTTASVDPHERAPVLRSLLVLPNDYGVLALVMVLLPWHAGFVVVYSVLAAAGLVFLLAGCVRWLREMTGLAATTTTTAVRPAPHATARSTDRA